VLETKALLNYLSTRSVERMLKGRKNSALANKGISHPKMGFRTKLQN
jgi:hypothetical protein